MALIGACAGLFKPLIPHPPYVPASRQTPCTSLVRACQVASASRATAFIPWTNSSETTASVSRGWRNTGRMRNTGRIGGHDWRRSDSTRRRSCRRKQMRWVMRVEANRDVKVTGPWVLTTPRRCLRPSKPLRCSSHRQLQKRNGIAAHRVAPATSPTPSSPTSLSATTSTAKSHASSHDSPPSTTPT
jgi:hypothetical protein